ncbi:amino acid adenylation domain-containing protein [Micromonospora pattaloongensis]|uniref:Amino acid adenylation domain-containing protein n=1 Tax=Micromonospora pattaloongensis TaxID=405436 RepID=A0A1H3JVJ5_9ACTN|nr:amino acid adenylation domain-containing protein [Micromonospora pattaloongensis]
MTQGDDVQLTYRELYHRARGVADELTSQGVCPGSLVGIVIDRSIDAVAAMVGVTLAGAAYVPLSPREPAARLRRIDALAGLRHMLVGSAEARDQVRDTLSGRCPVTDVTGIPAGSRSVEPSAGSASRLAYVMFTSGTTGTPKGVMVEHRGVVRLVTGTDYAPFGPDQRILHGAALEFDAATFELWGALLNGSSLHVISDEALVVPSELGALLRARQITIAWLTAPLFHQIVDEAPAELATLDTLITGGDVVSAAHVRRLRAISPGLRLINAYGPTENTTFSTVYPVPADVPDPLPIGRPIRGTTALVVGDDGAPAPDGTEGELWVGGSGLARGYLGDPVLTAERFVVRDGARWYRTGDRVGRRADGVLLFHGRTDDQVKISGRLVQPRGVDAVLLRLPGVRSAWTRVFDTPGTGPRLVSYVVGPVEPEAVLVQLRAQLPPYLCPQRVVVLPRLPLGPAGKVDWRALPDPGRGDAGSVPADRPGRLPGNDPHTTSSALAGLWAEILQVPTSDIGPASSFVGLGGDSLAFGRLAGRIARRLGVEVPLGALMAVRDLAEMTSLIDRAGVAARPRPAPATAGLHPAQRALYTRWLTDPDSLAYNIPFRIDLRGPVDPDRVRDAMSAVVPRHDVFDGRFELSAEGPRRAIGESAPPTFEYLPRPMAGDDAPFVRPFAPSDSPLVRARLVRLGPDRHELYIDVHHVVFDGISLSLFVEDFLGEYAGTTRPASAPTYREATDRHTQRLAADPYGDAVFWAGVFREPPPRLALPYDRPLPARRDDRGGVVRRTRPVERSAAVDALARRRGTTPFTVLFAAYVTLLARIAKATDIAVGVPMHGRVDPAFERTVGMFVNTVCLRVEVPAGATVAELLAEVDRRRRAALDHQAYPFDVLIDRLGWHRDPARTPLFDVFFALHAIPMYEFRSGALTASVDLLPTGHARFDLNLQVHPMPGALVVDLEYASAVFDRDTASRLLDEYLAVLDEIVDDPDVVVHRRVPVPDLPAFDFEDR